MVQEVERPPTIVEVQFMVKEKEKVLKEHIECAACKVINRLAKVKKEKNWRVRSKLTFEDLRKRYTLGTKTTLQSWSDVNV